jgi:hypothetical protein
MLNAEDVAFVVLVNRRRVIVNVDNEIVVVRRNRWHLRG